MLTPVILPDNYLPVIAIQPRSKDKKSLLTGKKMRRDSKIENIPTPQKTS